MAPRAEEAVTRRRQREYSWCLSSMPFRTVMMMMMMTTVEEEKKMMKKKKKKQARKKGSGWISVSLLWQLCV